MVMGDDSCSKGCGFESQRRKLDGQFDIFPIDLLLKLYCLFEKAKNKRNEAGKKIRNSSATVHRSCLQNLPIV